MSPQTSTSKPAASLQLVDYSSSEDEEDDETTSTTKLAVQKHPSTPLPPLPSRFHDLYTTAPRLSSRDDPSVHHGRVRSIPHIEGNWPTHVFLEWHPNITETETIQSIFSAAEGVVGQYLKWHPKDAIKLHSFIVSDLGVALPLHVSLSRPIVLVSEQRSVLMELLEKKIKKSGVEPFEMSFTQIEWVPNQDRTRWFYVVKCTSPSSELTRLLSSSNQVARTLKQPELYAGQNDDGFHISLAWTLSAPSPQLQNDIQQAVVSWVGALSELRVKTDVVKVKIGNVVSLIRLEKDFT